MTGVTAADPPAGSREPGFRGSRYAGLARGAGTLACLVIAAGLFAAVAGTAITDPPAVPGVPQPGPAVRYGIPVARVLLDLGAVAVAGLAILAKLLGFDRPEQTEPVMEPARRMAVWASAVWAAAALVSIVLLAAELDPGVPVTAGGVWTYIGSIAAGKGLLVSAGCALLSVWLCWLAVRHGERVPAELRAGLALFGLLPLPLTGHASNWYYHDLSMVSMELHVVGAAAWAGGLAAVTVLLARHRDLLALALPRFSRLATWCVVVVGVSGLANGLLELALSPISTLPGSLLTTRYGVLVLAKIACLAVVAVIAVQVRGRILPAVAAGRRSTFTVWCGGEVAVLAVAYGVAVVLTRAAVTPF
jgi:putative copper resistance protein D